MAAARNVRSIDFIKSTHVNCEKFGEDFGVRGQKPQRLVAHPPVIAQHQQQAGHPLGAARDSAMALLIARQVSRFD
jgi:hypothetical protein